MVSHTFSVSISEAMAMEMVELLGWAGEAVDLWKRLYGPRRR